MNARNQGLLMEEAARSGRAALPMTEAERAARVRLAAAYRVFDHLGWSESIFNHITMRVPGPEPVFLINPFGLMYREVKASNLVAVDLEGQPVRPADHPINRAGFVIHSAIHGHLAQAHCVMHTHTTTGSAVACLEAGLSHHTFYGSLLNGHVAYHDFEGVTIDPAEKERLLASIGSQRLLILRNHGLLSWGETVEEAWLSLWTLQRACDIQIAAASAGPLRKVADSVLAQTRGSARAEPAVARAAFDAMVRAVDKVDPSYRD
jgi:ribulose-5-phosphate 4-epimerase/fuculose-1-phosphate aldolase